MGGRRHILSSKSYIFSALVLAFLSIGVSASLLQDLNQIKYPDCDWHDVEQRFHHGGIHGFYRLEEVYEVFHFLQNKVPEIFALQYESHTQTNPFKAKKQKVYAWVLTSKADQDQMDLEEKAGIIFTGGHRADEPMTVSQTLYIALYWVHRYHAKDKGMMHFLTRSAAWFIPVVNPDGYIYFTNNWKAANQPPPVRKNRVFVTGSKCDINHIGVDLNRNYDYNWTGVAENGTVCDQDYPGTHAVSEIENQFVTDVVYGSHRDMRIGVNFMGAHGLWRMPHNVTHLHHGHDLYHQVKKEANIDLNDTVTGLTGDVTDWMYFTRNITAFSALVGIQDDNGLLNPAPNQARAIEMFNKTLWSVNYLYAMLPPNLEHDFTVWETTPPHYIPETAVNASKFKLTMVVQAFNKGLSAKKNVHVGIQLNGGIHADLRHSPPFHMHYEIISEEQITRANDQEKDYRIQGKFTSGELKKHDVQPLHVHWNTSWYHGHQNITIYSHEAISVPERHFLRVYVLIHRKVGRHVNFDVKIKPVDPLDKEYVLDHVTWTPPTLDDHEGLGGGAIFLIIMTIFLLLFVPLCVCYIYMKRTQGEKDSMSGLAGDYMMYKDDKGVEML